MSGSPGQVSLRHPGSVKWAQQPPTVGCILTNACYSLCVRLLSNKSLLVSDIQPRFCKARVNTLGSCPLRNRRSEFVDVTENVVCEGCLCPQIRGRLTTVPTACQRPGPGDSNSEPGPVPDRPEALMSVLETGLGRRVGRADPKGLGAGPGPPPWASRRSLLF